MQLVLRALLVMGLAVLPHATARKLGCGARQKGRTMRLRLDQSVQPQVRSTSGIDIANMSLSPWTYRDSCVESRFPRCISEAQCLTAGCLSLQGGGEDAALEAQPIRYQVLVLHRVQRQRCNKTGGRKAGRRYHFILGTQVITVGCTCVRPSVVPQQ